MPQALVSWIQDTPTSCSALVLSPPGNTSGERSTNSLNLLEHPSTMSLHPSTHGPHHHSPGQHSPFPAGSWCPCPRHPALWVSAISTVNIEILIFFY